MKKLSFILLILFTLLLTSCSGGKSPTGDTVNEYDIYRTSQGFATCDMEVEFVYHTDEEYEYFLSWSSCDDDEIYFIRNGNEFITLTDALELEMFTIEELIPYLSKREITVDW